MSELTKEKRSTLLDTPPVQFTKGALQELKTLLYEKDVPDTHRLRVGVKGGGCSGLSYILGFDVKKDGDIEFEVEGVPMILDKTHTMYLIGMEVDYMSGLNNRGFVFNNPNASSTCGCGSSFAS